MSTADTMRLTPNDILVLVVLMAEARELDNNELKELAGFALTGEDNTRLEKRYNLVETDRTHRPFSHQLTDKGWAFVRELHTNAPPSQGKSATRSLFTLMANLNRALERQHVSHGEFFKQSADGGDTESRIRAAYRSLPKAPGGWVGLADLRDALPDLDRKIVDEALLGMVDRDGVRIIPAANTKALKPRDRAAALRIGNEDSHAISMSPA
jgi:hypothetical protein